MFAAFYLVGKCDYVAAFFSRSLSHITASICGMVLARTQLKHNFPSRWYAGRGAHVAPTFGKSLYDFLSIRCGRRTMLSFTPSLCLSVSLSLSRCWIARKLITVTLLRICFSCHRTVFKSCHKTELLLKPSKNSEAKHSTAAAAAAAV